jgi:DNA-binding NarL/FixJ family response regulator
LAVGARDDLLGADKAAARPPNILIVEDDYLIAWEIETALTEAGFHIAGIAHTAEQALELARSADPLLALMDIRLKGKRDGIDVALELFRTQGIRCVFATAHHDAAARARAQPAEPLGWLPKPYALSSLVTAVRQAARDLAEAGNR